MGELVVKDNALINASYNLELVEQRLILLAIIEARESGKGINANDPLTIHAESYINQFNVHRNTAYAALKDACKDLFARQFSYQERRGKGTANITSRWVSQIAYVDDHAVVELIFAPAIIPLITRLEEQLTKYDIEQISALKSGYAVRLYEQLISWRSAGKTPILELSEFRKRMGVLNTEYLQMSDFKKRVIDAAVAQINEHSDISVTYEQHKSGKIITGFSFKFKFKKQDKPIDAPAKPKQPETQAPQVQVSAFAGLQLVLLKEIQKKHPEITEKYVRDYADQNKLDIVQVLEKIKDDYQNAEEFSLEKTD